MDSAPAWRRRVASRSSRRGGPAVARSFRPDVARVSAVIERLRKRRDFLKAQKGRRANTGLFSVLAVRKDAGPARIGYTVSKKVDNRAVKRNRIRRRLKEATLLEGEAFRNAPADFVVIARRDALTADFSRIRSDLRRAMAKALGPDGPITEQGAAPQRSE